MLKQLRQPQIMAKAALLRGKLSMPSALVGLVVFSFTLLVLGATVYTSALPSLFGQAAAARDAEPAAQGSAEGEDVGEGAGEGADASAASDAAKAGVAVSAGAKARGATAAASAKNAEGTASDTSVSGAAQGAGGSSASGSGTSGGGSSSGGSGAVDSDPTPGIDQDKEAKLYNLLVAKANGLDGLVGRASAQMSAFDASADAATCSSRANECAMLSSQLLGEMSSILNSGYFQNGTSYRAPYESLVAMHRCLYQAMDALASGWQAAGSSSPDTGYINSCVDAANARMDEYNRYAAGFSL